MDLSSFTFRKARGDTIETYKYLHGIYMVNSLHMLPLHTKDTELLLEDTASNYRKETAGYSLKLQKSLCRTQF